MEFISALVLQSLGQVWVTLTHNWPFLLVSILISVGLRLYINPQKVSAFLARYRRVGVVGATAAAVTTPFCSCGTTAVILGMMASTIPWAPIVAFMVASPLTSPEELVYSAGLFGWPFAIAFFGSSIMLGLLGGALAEIFESRGWLANQARFRSPAAPQFQAAKEHKPLASSSAVGCSCQTVSQPVLAASTGLLTSPVLAASSSASACGCGPALPTRLPVLSAAPAMATGAGLTTGAVLDANPVLAASSRCGPAQTAALPVLSAAPAAGASGCGQPRDEEIAKPQEDEHLAPASEKDPVTLRRWLEEIYRTGRQLLVMFLGFAFIGYLLNGLIPPAWVAAIFGVGNAYSVPLAATLGLPLYINTEGSLPLIRALIDGGMSQGAALAFLITGAGTSFGAVAGALTIARWRVIALVVGTLWVGAVVLGYAYDLLLASHMF